MKFDIVHMNYCGYDIIENIGQIRVSYIEGGLLMNILLLLNLFKNVYMTQLKVTNVDVSTKQVTIELFDNSFIYQYE